ncbi:MAG: M20/M25/M40 family metallo-hydrolase [Acidobacteria bacterium]|nr:M20/M25/M40 family metallo-hydrolase [Acidobacteriota bacterium]
MSRLARTQATTAPDDRHVSKGARFALLAVLVFVASVAPGHAGAGPASPDEVWVTLERDAFDLSRRALPVRADGASPPRLAESGDVLLTRLPEAWLEPLAEAIHRELGHRGGFVVHPTLEAGREEIERLERARLFPEAWETPRTPAFAVGQPSWVAATAGAVGEAEILDTMTALSTEFVNRYHAHATGSSAAAWIRDLWSGYATAAGRPEVVVELVAHATTPQPSVVLTLPGTTFPDQIVILGGHEDSTVSGCSVNPSCVAPGADDNASGIATISEAIRVLLASGLQPQRTIQVMAYAAEEVGLRGSAAIAQAYLDAGTNVVAVLQQDMTGYYGSAEDVVFISDYTNADLTAFLADLVETYQPGLLWTTTECNYGCSDHASWHTRGYPASFAFESRFGEHDPYIHSADDTVANLGSSAAHAAKFARLSAAYLAETTLLHPDTLLADGFERGTLSAWTALVQEP